MPTPLAKDGSVDRGCIRTLVDFLIEGGIDGLFPLGTSGEFALLSREERRAVVAAVVDQADGRVPVFAGVSDPSTENVVRFSADAKDAGADGVIATPPYYYSTTNEGLYNHFKLVTEEVDLPLMIYNIPEWTHVFVPPEVVRPLAEEKRNKAKLAMDQAQSNIDKMRVTSPMDGLVALEKNEGAAGGFFFSGMSLPEYREGDQVEPGRSVGQVVDAKEMELSAKVGELERNNIKEGQSVDIQLDALPGNTFHGTVKTVGGANTRRMWDDDTATKFEVTVKLVSSDPRMRPGLTAHIFINGDSRKDVLMPLVGHCF
jgi:hypothetical protein